MMLGASGKRPLSALLKRVRPAPKNRQNGHLNIHPLDYSRLEAANQIVGPFRFQKTGSPAWTRTGDWAVNSLNYQPSPRVLS